MPKREQAFANIPLRVFNVEIHNIGSILLPIVNNVLGKNTEGIVMNVVQM